jgi:adenylyl-sulfate kinase
MSSNLTWHKPQITAEDRHKLYGNKPCTVWFTGLSGSGKSTLAFALERELVEMGHACYVLDGDNVRHGLNRDLGFSPADRSENIRRIAEVAKLMNDAGLIVICAFISPYRADRDNARQIVGEGIFVEAYISASLETCEARDPKGLYAKARQGGIANFTGISAPYEAPLKPEIVIDTGKLGVDDSVSSVLAFLNENAYIGYVES